MTTALLVALIALGFSIAFCAGLVLAGIFASGKIADLEAEISMLERVK